ncbi:hypothetical protein [Umezawaea sp. Da 62-37]|uniref:hypothetical protein n=1 Tax=Umezawaea sp. Da 62-37 TaxID=3075927 RepID=UPI0028F70CDF|nr:hypothetical protein [Umezawaea sp. Da 62-37]WNV83719.1 hypothetical protein RM788_36885 [Umezawaea sp. Da 62-37]
MIQHETSCPMEVSGRDQAADDLRWLRENPDCLHRTRELCAAERETLRTMGAPRKALRGMTVRVSRYGVSSRMLRVYYGDQLVTASVHFPPGAAQ